MSTATERLINARRYGHVPPIPDDLLAQITFADPSPEIEAAIAAHIERACAEIRRVNAYADRGKTSLGNTGTRH